MIIGLCGFKGSGKDTIGNYLESQYNFEKISFGGPLKDITAILFNWPRHMLEGDTHESRQWRETTDEFWSKTLEIDNFNPRYAMQYVGTEIIRKGLCYDIWVELCRKRIQTSKAENIVVTDCRFTNELKSIEDLGGYNVRVKSGSEPNWFDLALEANQGNLNAEQKLQDMCIHTSERDWIGYPFDFVVKNDSDFAFLEKSTDDMLNALMR